MRSLLDFLYRNRVIAYFGALQLLCFILILNTNSFYGSSFFNSSNRISGSINAFSENIGDFVQLRETNRLLAEQNANLRRQMADMVRNRSNVDSIEVKYEILPAKVINKSYRRSRNFLTLNIGEEDGIKPGMGVISSDGIVGRVHAVSKKYSAVSSILNPSILTSCRVKRLGTLCTAQWEEQDFRTISIKYIPRHIALEKGDTIETSGYNYVFPEGVIVGVVDAIELRNESPFYDVKATLSVDITSLEYTHVVINPNKDEIDSLEYVTTLEL